MNSATEIWVVVLLAVMLLLLVRLGLQNRLLSTLKKEQLALADAWRSRPVDISQVPASRSRPVIAIEILNPFELAASESPFAGPVSNFAPDMIRKIVYKRTVEIMREQLSERGVQAEIIIHGLA